MKMLKKNGEEYLICDKIYPTFYVDFPLVGSETLNFPLSISCKDFYPDEPRSALQQGSKTDLNNNLLLEFKEVFTLFLE